MWYQPLQRQSDKRWDYTSSSGSSSYPIGYCGGWKEYTPEELADIDAKLGEGFSERLIKERDRNVAFKHKFHKDGHATSEEACACYKQYVFECEREQYIEKSIAHKCAECGVWMSNITQFGRSLGKRLYLCDEHMTEEMYAKHYRDAR